MAQHGEKKYVIIHGHFYQPPREDPWTGRIDRQDSAFPWHDWNERINEECYAANSDARLLDSYGQIKRIVNNYTRLSFNFGPTLLRWIEEFDPETYQRILDADAESAALNNGHGNAIAQVYNHIIMPLANLRDKRTQVRWGMADFRRRFKREAESIWLAETAVNLDTVDVLIEEGIRYLILSPTQAEAVFTDGQWQDVSNNSIDTSRAYYIRGRQGKLAVFFYDMDISKAVGFEHLLRSEENFRNRLLAAANNQPDSPRMVNIATDGESYGHHEPFANMCLSALAEDVEENRPFELTNYGAFLEKFPAEQEVRLKAGNNNLGTAWSCAHGVGRWMEDCGCSDGGQAGWNQRWRRPLRMAFDLLRDELAAVCEAESAGLLRDFWEARDGYIDVVLNDTPEQFSAFLNKHRVKELTREEESKLRRLLEAQKFSMFSYTSCGWFFAEISGLEGVQCLRYASRAFELAQPWLPQDCEERFKEILEEAASNIPRFQNGRWVYENFVQKYRLDHRRVVNQFVFERVLTGQEPAGDMYFYRLQFDTFQTDEEHPGGAVYSGTVTLQDQVSLEEGRYLFYLIRPSHLDMYCYIKPFTDERICNYLDEIIAEQDGRQLDRTLQEWFPERYTMQDLKFDCREQLVRELFKSVFLGLHARREEHTAEYLELLEYYAGMGIPVPELERSSLEAAINTELLYLLEQLEQDQQLVDFARIARLLQTAEKTRLEINRSMVEELFAGTIRQRMERFFSHEVSGEAGSAEFEKLIELVGFANGSGLNYRRKELENRLYLMLEREVLPGLARPEQFAADPLRWEQVQRSVHLAALLNLSVSSIRKKMDRIERDMERTDGTDQ